MPNTIAAHDTLMKIVIIFGQEILSNPKKTGSAFLDLAPELRQEHRVLSIILKDHLIDGVTERNLTDQERKIEQNRIRIRLEDYHLIQREVADSMAQMVVEAATLSEEETLTFLLPILETEEGDRLKKLILQGPNAYCIERIWKKAAQLKEAKGNYILACQFRDKDTWSSSNQAFSLFYKGAEAGYLPAQVELAKCYQRGKGVKKDLEKAKEWAAKAANQGDKEAQFLTGNLSSLMRDKKEAAEWFQKAAEQGFAPAQIELARIYRFKNSEKACFWFLKAAEQGNIDAQVETAEAYYYGRIGLRPDYKKAREWAEKAANGGDKRAQFRMGVLYDSGRGVERDSIKAIEWYQKAAQQGNEKARYYLAKLYEKGRGVAKDLKKANYWYPPAKEKTSLGVIQYHNYYCSYLSDIYPEIMQARLNAIIGEK